MYERYSERKRQMRGLASERGRDRVVIIKRGWEERERGREKKDSFATSDF